MRFSSLSETEEYSRESGRIGAERPGEEHAGEERPGEEHLDIEHTGGDCSGIERIGAERPCEEHAGEERPDCEGLFSRTEMLVGSEAMDKLATAKVAVFGLGGVGGSCAEALARSGVGSLDLFDGDVVSLSNINRQVIALHSTVGRPKAGVMAERIRDINPACRVRVCEMFYMPDTAGVVDISLYDYVVDAIDTVAGKVELIERAKSAGVKIICSMGAAYRMDPTQFVVTDIQKTEADPLARVMRKELRARGISDVKVVWSRETPLRRCGENHPHCDEPCNEASRNELIQAHLPGGTPNSHLPASSANSHLPASSSFVPPACGLVLASEVVKDLIGSA